MSPGARESGRDAAERAALLDAPPVPPRESLRYGNHPAQVVDLYGAGPPGVAVLHGGFWRERFDRTHLSPLAAELAARGMCVALVEYRRAGGGGGWPATGDDVAAALAALPGGGPVVVAGHSAGGHLALWAASCAASRVAHTVAVSPVADLADAKARELGGGAVADFLGPRWAEVLPDADPMRLPTPAAPVTVLHGVDDGQVPLQQSLDYAERHGARLLRLPGAGHYAPCTPGTAAFTTLALVLERVAAPRS